jgi:hypothetical protein
MSYSMADEYDRRMRARRIEYERRCDAVVYDPNNPLTMFPEAIVDREMAAEAVTAAAARAEAYAVKVFERLGPAPKEGGVRGRALHVRYELSRPIPTRAYQTFISLSR